MDWSIVLKEAIDSVDLRGSADLMNVKNTRREKVFLDGDWQNKTEEIPPYKLAV